MPHAGGYVPAHQYPADVHTVGLGRFQQSFAEKIIPHTTHHGDIGSQPGALQSLIGAFSAGSHMEGLAIYGLTGAGDLLRGGNHIHYKTAYNKNPRFSMHGADYSC